MEGNYSKLLFATVTVIFAMSSSLTANAASPDPCSLLTQSQVSTALGTSVDAGKSMAGMCQWSAPSQPNSMNGKKVTLVMRTAEAFAYAKRANPRITVAPASGIGDDAVYDTNHGATPGFATSLSVKKGDAYFVVHIYGFPDADQVKAMEKALALQVLAKL
jgi:hypothetical protein